MLLFPVSKEFKDNERGIEFQGRVAHIRTGGRGDALTMIEGARLKFRGKEITK